MKKLLIISALIGSVAQLFATDYLITNFGATTDSTRLNTTAIQSVIDKAADNGGGVVVIPRGVFLSGALFFRQGVQLRLEEGAKLKGSDNIADYPLKPSRMEGKKLDYFSALINADGLNNFSITGKGVIDGNALKFWKQFWAYRDSMKAQNKVATNLDVHRPRLVFINNSRNILIQGVKLCNSGFWTTHLYQCKDILIENCSIQSPKTPVPAPSTDGIDLDVCSNVIVRNCYISVNDDAVCIKGGKGPLAQKLPENGIVENILVENCTMEYPSPAVVTLGSECIHARNISIRNCKVINCKEVLLLKMRPDTYQLYEDISIDGVTGNCDMVIRMAPWKQFFNLEGTSEKPFGTVRNIFMTHIKTDCAQFGFMAGNPNDKVSNIHFKDIDIKAKSSLFKNEYTDVHFENVLVNGIPFRNNAK